MFFAQKTQKLFPKTLQFLLHLKPPGLANIGSIMVPRDFGAGHLKLNY